MAQSGTFSNLQVNWAGSLGSDHTCLQIDGCTQQAANQPSKPANLGFVIDLEQKEEWIKNFEASPPPLLLPSIPTAKEVEQAVAELFENIQMANENTFHRRHPYHPKATPWWNKACANTVQKLCHTENKDASSTKQARLRRTVRVAKCQWADKYIENAQLWDVAAWHHSCRVAKVPSLHGPNRLVHSHKEVMDVLSQRFFAKTPPQVELHFHDDPP
jgi:hypothetical protein